MAFEMQQLCSNYTSKPKVYNDKYIMGIVGSTKDGFIISVYSFKHYSQVSVEATVTSTTCKGLFSIKSKYSFYSLKASFHTDQR